MRNAYAGGGQVVADGRALSLDAAAASAALEEAQMRSVASVPKSDWDGRTADELAPMVLPVRPG